MALYNTNNALVDVQNHYNCKHLVNLNNSKFKDIVGKDKILVNSYHHQQVLDSKEFKIVGKSSDSIIEVVEGVYSFFQIGVEWHPERMLDDESSDLLFSKFINCVIEK